jgi:hypothetical protein
VNLQFQEILERVSTLEEDAKLCKVTDATPNMQQIEDKIEEVVEKYIKPINKKLSKMNVENPWPAPIAQDEWEEKSFQAIIKKVNMEATTIPKADRKQSMSGKVDVVLALRSAVPFAPPDSVAAMVYEELANLWSFKDSGKVNRVSGGAKRIIRWYRDSALNGRERPPVLPDTVVRAVAKVLQEMFVEMKYLGVADDQPVTLKAEPVWKPTKGAKRKNIK